MKKYNIQKLTKILLLFFFTTQIGFSQSVYTALNHFLSQDFFSEYEELRSRAEESVRQFKYVQHKYSEEEITNVMYGYDAAAGYFNSVLLNIKNDLLDKRKRNYMVQFSEDYAKQIEADLYRAREFYENTYQKEVIKVTNGEITGAAFLALLPKIIGYAKTAFSVYKKIKKQMKKFNEDLLDKHLIQRYKFKKWNEIQ